MSTQNKLQYSGNIFVTMKCKDVGSDSICLKPGGGGAPIRWVTPMLGRQGYGFHLMRVGVSLPCPSGGVHFPDECPHGPKTCPILGYFGMESVPDPFIHIDTYYSRQN